ncbi:hypothetical protein EVAR_55314_1 [Eumeta japonica]|uniref:Uncharacterized protein n=1 Tax=Eumeta variegata TaxID=151549 RepID=A0A4C1ZA81_EUMVA|nr:hypothetical protein EVAR_55314_1 [Eumeta japonica]
MLMTYFYTFLTLPSPMLSRYCLSPCWLCSCIFTPLDWSFPLLKVTWLFSQGGERCRMSVVLGNVRILCKNSIKFLGLYFDSKLSGTDHCNYIITKVEKYINILSCLSGTWWDAHPYFFKLLYNGIVRSHLDYGSFLLEPMKSFEEIEPGPGQSSADNGGLYEILPYHSTLQHSKLNAQIHLFLFADSFYLTVSYPNHCGFQSTP